MSTRRELLKLGTMAAASALLPARVDASRGTSRTGAVADLPTTTRERFQGQLRATFVVRPDHQPEVSLILAEVSDPAFAAAAGRKGHPECFRAVFRGAATAPLGQGTYLVSNEGLGEFPLFLVPVGPPVRGARYYEAAFNRVVPGSTIS